VLTGDGPVPVPEARAERTADGRPRAPRYWPYRDAVAHRTRGRTHGTCVCV